MRVAVRVKVRRIWRRWTDQRSSSHVVMFTRALVERGALRLRLRRRFRCRIQVRMSVASRSRMTALLSAQITRFHSGTLG